MSKSRYTTDEYVAKVVAQAPPLTIEQKARIARLLGSIEPKAPETLVVDAGDVLDEMRSQ